MDTLDGVIETKQLDVALRDLVPEMVAAGAVVRDDCTVMLEMQTAAGVVGIDITSRARQAMTAVRHRRSVERRRTRGYRLMRRPRARGAGRPKAAPARRAAAVGARDGPGEEGPDEPAPALALASPPKAILDYAVSRCPECGGVLLWSGGVLICCTRSCPRYGKGAA